MAIVIVTLMSFEVEIFCIDSESMLISEVLRFFVASAYEVLVVGTDWYW